MWGFPALQLGNNTITIDNIISQGGYRQKFLLLLMSLLYNGFE